MQSNVTIALRICLKWLRSGSKQELHFAQLVTCTLRQAVDMTLQPITSMPQTAIRRYGNDVAIRIIYLIVKYFHHFEGGSKRGCGLFIESN